MSVKKFKAVLEVLLISTVLYLGHKLLFVFSSYHLKSESFNYTLENIYAVFVSCSLVIIFILTKVKDKNIDNVGYTFLLLTFVKMAIAYIFLSTIINNTHKNSSFEKINFFAVFALFLATETIVTIRLLNKKQ
ncbi:MAG TPA: hypothetical protein VN192_01735 [Flavobacterium sp.]|jgi:predicted membrane channel-forming protein YqfA (hemolysin III family)|nr:hypothetical protein [Flavobacterium sp.]